MTFEKATDIEKKLVSKDLSVINACLDLAKDLVTTEQGRDEAVRGRAGNLLGFAGIVAALTTDLVTLIQVIRTKNQCLFFLTGTLYVVMLGSLFVSIWLAFGGNRRFVTARPNIDDIVDYQALNELETKKSWLASLISAYKVTADNVNKRVTTLYTAQQFLTFALILLLITVALGVVALALP